MARTPDRTAKKDWAPRFLGHLAECGSVVRAARKAKVARSVVYERRESDPAFARAWDDALGIAVELMEAEARRRAYEGTLRPVYQKGELVGKVREYSDTLMIFLLKAHRPGKYRENARVVVAGEAGSPVEVQHEHRFTLTPDDLRAAEQLARLAGAELRPDGGPEPVPAPHPAP